MLYKGEESGNQQYRKLGSPPVNRSRAGDALPEYPLKAAVLFGLRGEREQIALEAGRTDVGAADPVRKERHLDIVMDLAVLHFIAPGVGHHAFSHLREFIARGVLDALARNGFAIGRRRHHDHVSFLRVDDPREIRALPSQRRW